MILAKGCSIKEQIKDFVEPQVDIREFLNRAVLATLLESFPAVLMGDLEWGHIAGFDKQVLLGAKKDFMYRRSIWMNTGKLIPLEFF